MKYKYLVLSGTVVSRTDGDIHIMTCKQLMELYKVKPSECLCNPDLRWVRREELAGLIYLHPRYDGNYDLTLATTYLTFGD
jgi:hypothetical protein